MITPATMVEAGGRLFVDVTRRLASPASRAALLKVIARPTGSSVELQEDQVAQGALEDRLLDKERFVIAIG